MPNVLKNVLLMLLLFGHSHSSTIANSAYHPDEIFPSHFISTHFQQKPYHFHLNLNGDGNSAFNMATVTSIKMIELIKSMDYHTASTHVKLASKSIPQHCQHDGKTCLLHDQKKSTIILDGAEDLFLDLFRFVKIWKTVLGIFVGLNLYLTPPNEQGLLWHSDKTDVIIFQLEGKSTVFFLNNSHYTYCCIYSNPRPSLTNCKESSNGTFAREFCQI